MRTASIRPMEERDVPGVHEAMLATFADLNARMGDPPEPEPPLEQTGIRLRHLLATDPGGSWVADRDGEVVGCALALVREGVWGLSLLIVRPEAQSSGVGRELLARSHEYADGARGRIVLASKDSRAIGAYLRLGLDMHPAAIAHGRPRAVAPPQLPVRPAEPADRPWMDAVGRMVRGAPHGGDLDAFARAGAAVSVVPERGYAVWRGGSCKLIAALDEEAARALLRAGLAAAATECSIDYLTSQQQWAIRECVDAGLRFEPSGPVLTSGELGTLRPYLPSGAYL